jgi:hypothetical protein
MRALFATLVTAALVAAGSVPALARGHEAASGPVVATDTASSNASPRRPVHSADAETVTPAVATGGDVSLLATCSGCGAYNVMYWTNYGAWESVGVQRTQNVASEVIDRQETHVALMNSTINQCYDGEYRFTDATGDLFNQTNSPQLSSGKYSGFNDRWTQASGHNWYDEGGHFAVNGANDRCRQF